MKHLMRNYLTAFLFALFGLGSLSIPTLAFSNDNSPPTTPTETQTDEEPECE